MDVEMLTAAEAASRIGDDDPQRFLERGRRRGLPVFSDPRDRRRRVLDPADFAVFARPLPVTPRPRTRTEEGAEA